MHSMKSVPNFQTFGQFKCITSIEISSDLNMLFVRLILLAMLCMMNTFEQWSELWITGPVLVGSDLST
jgi:hypothetical protein